MIAVDASVCLKWIFAEQYSEQAVALAEHAQRTHQRLIAPPLLLIEVTNVIRQRMRSEGLSLEDAENALARFLAFGVSIRPAAPAGQAALQHSALCLAAEYDLPAVYDAQYLALAKRLGCELWTDDRRLLGALYGRFPALRPIRAYGPEAQGAVPKRRTKRS